MKNTTMTKYDSDLTSIISSNGIVLDVFNNGLKKVQKERIK